MRISDWSSDVCSSDLGVGGRNKQDVEQPPVAEPHGAKPAEYSYGGWSECGGYEAAEPNGKPCRSQRIAIVAGDPIRSQYESDERACDATGTQSRQADAQQCPVSRHPSMQSRDRKSTRLNSSH